MAKDKIIVLNFLNGEVHIHDYIPVLDDFEDENMEQWLCDNGYSPPNSQWMVVEKLKIVEH